MILMISFLGGGGVRQEYDAIDGPGHPIYRTDTVAIVYLDFLDGRDFSDGITRKQPLYTSQLAFVENLDAVGEIGLTYEQSPYPVNLGLYINASKYKWLDRWNMFFSIDGTYRGAAHPDYITHHAIYGTQAYGSFTEYWNEVSNGYYKIIPAVTHSNETDIKYKTGIVNNYKVLNNGDRIIEYIMLPRKKYSQNPSEAYFPNEEFYSYDSAAFNFDRVDMVIRDAQKRLADLYAHDSISFNYHQFKGKIIFIFAGSHQKLKGVTSEVPLCRGMYNNIHNQEAQIDGFTCIAHEYGHYALKWLHSIGGRNCLMNTNQTKDINCPSHPNPIFKLREGWLSAVHLDSSQNNIQLDPIETSHKAGIITIYGKPSAAPDYLSGECYVIENRKRIGFDQQLFKAEDTATSKGGLLIWHYSPYTSFDTVIGPGAVDYSIKLITPINASPDSIYFNNGEVRYFFAYNNNISNYFYYLLSNRTYSQENLKTGIDISDIHQLDYGDFNSKIQFNLNYTISEPTRYDTVIYSRTPAGVITSSGKIFFHAGSNNNIYLNLLPGSIIEGAPNRAINVKGIKAPGDDNNPIIIKSTGYSNSNESYICKSKGVSVQTFNTNGLCDSLILRNIKFVNMQDSVTALSISNLANTIDKVTIENIYINNSKPNPNYDINLFGVMMNSLKLDSVNIRLAKMKFYDDITINNSKIEFCVYDLFNHNVNSIFNNSIISNYPTNPKTQFNCIDGNKNWKGIQINGGAININGASFINSETAISLNGVNGGSVKNFVFLRWLYLMRQIQQRVNITRVVGFVKTKNYFY